jgi:hypothetical protein
MPNYGPFGPGVVKGSNSGAGAYDVTSYPNYNTSPAVAPLIKSELAKKSFPSMVQYLLPKGDATLLGLSEKVKEETALQVEHGFFAKTMVFPTFQVGALLNDGTTQTVTVIDSSQCLPNGLYRRVGVVDTGTGTTLASSDNTLVGEIVRIISVTNATTIVVQRNVGAVTTQTSIPNNSLFVHIGSAFANASNRPDSFLTREIRVINYTQIFRNAWAISGTVSAIQNAIGDTNTAKSKEECAKYHAMDMENSMIWGRRSVVAGVANTNYNSTTMNGVVAQITDPQAGSLFLPASAGGAANIATANSGAAGQLNMTDLETWANNLFDMAYDPSSGMERVIFVGRTARVALNKLCRINGTYDIQNGQTAWGLRFSRITLTRGDLIMIEHPMLNTNPFWQTLIIALDIPAISVAYLVGRKTQSEEYNQKGVAVDNAIDAVGGSLLTECTVLNKNPAGCGVMTNVRVAVSG